MIRRISRFLILPGLLAITATAVAQRDRDTFNPNNQAFEVSGQVTVVETKQLARDVPVRLERFAGGVIDQISTDSHGRFRFTNLQRGYYKVIINAPGYNPVQQDADLTFLFRTYLVFELNINNATNNGGLPALADVIDARVPADAREQFAQGRAALAKKSYPEAISHLQKAVFLYSGFFEAQLLLATAFVDTREWDKAETVLQRALELRSDNATATISLGEVYWRQKRFDEAETTLLDGLKLDDKSWHGYFTLARLYWDRENIAKAAPAIGHTLQLKPDFAEAHLLAGNILLKINQHERARAEYQEYLRLEPKGEFAVQARELVQKLTKAIGENKQ